MTHRLAWSGNGIAQLEPLLSREWLVANGLGGYASGTVVGVATRRYHGLLVAALPAPLGRMLMLAQLREAVRLPNGEQVHFAADELRGDPPAASRCECSAEFRVEMGLPFWRYRVDDMVLEKSVLLVHQQNTAQITYRLEGPAAVELTLFPAVHFRPHDAPVSTPLPSEFEFHAADSHYEISAGPQLPVLRLYVQGAEPAFGYQPKTLSHLVYRVERERGYDCEGELWSPGSFRIDLRTGEAVTLVASTEPWDVVEALRPDEAVEGERQRRGRLLAGANSDPHDETARELVLASDAFIIRPAGRRQDVAAMAASGDDVRSVVAG